MAQGKGVILKSQHAVRSKILLLFRKLIQKSYSEVNRISFPVATDFASIIPDEDCREGRRGETDSSKCWLIAKNLYCLRCDLLTGRKIYQSTVEIHQNIRI